MGRQNSNFRALSTTEGRKFSILVVLNSRLMHLWADPKVRHLTKMCTFGKDLKICSVNLESCRTESEVTQNWLQCETSFGSLGRDIIYWAGVSLSHSVKDKLRPIGWAKDLRTQVLGIWVFRPRLNVFGVLEFSNLSTGVLNLWSSFVDCSYLQSKASF